MKSRRKSKNKFRKTYKKGGEVLGYGATGWVLGNPAYPCRETQIGRLDGYISKIAKSERANIDLENEFKASSLLRELGKKTGIDINNYFILHYDYCKVNRAYQFMLGTPYTIAWRIMGNEILNINDKNMLLYRKGSNNLKKILEKNNGFNAFHSDNTKISNIAKGILILQNNDLIHNDIKPENCILDENTFKIIDLSDIRDIRRTANMITMPYNFPYFTWPAIAALTAVYVYSDITLTNFNSNVLLELYRRGNGEKYNEEQYSIWMKETLYEPFTGFIMDDIMNAKINEYAKTLIYQKTFGIVQNVTESNYNEQISKFLLYSKRQHPEQEIIDIDVNECLGYYSNIMKKIARKGLLKRIDIYSFGIIILTNIYQLIKHLPQPKTDIRQHIVKYYIFGLYNLAFYCCYQTENTPDMNFIVDYFDTLNELYGYTLNASVNNNTDELTIETGTIGLTIFPDINTITQEEFNQYKIKADSIKNKIETQPSLIHRKRSNSATPETKIKPGSLKLPGDNSPRKSKIKQPEGSLI